MSIDDRLHSLFSHDEDSAYQPSDQDWEAIRARVGQRRQRPSRKVLTVALALGLAGLAIGFLFASFRTTRMDSRPGTDARPRSATVEASLAVGRFPRAMAADSRSVWVALPETDADLSDACSGDVVRVDTVTNEVADRIAVNGTANDIATDGASAWVVLRPGCSRTGQHDELVKVDASAARPSKRFSLEAPGDQPGHARLVDVGLGNAWVTRTLDNGKGEVLRLDLLTGQVLARLPMAFAPEAVLISGGSVWVTGAAPSPELARVDPQTNHVATLTTPEALAGLPLLTLVGFERDLWVGFVTGDLGLVSSDAGVRVYGGGPDYVLVGADDAGVFFVGSVGQGTVLGHVDGVTGESVPLVALDSSPPIDAQLVGSTIWLLSYDGELTRAGLGG